MSDRDPNLSLWAALAAPFANDEVRTRNQGGRELTYVTARVVMNRLDEVLGPTNWRDDYQPIGDSAIICRLTLRLPDGEEITKTDAGGMSNTNDPSDSEKSGFSDAFKRAAVKFGVGRYLYGDGVPRSIHAELVEQRRRAAGAPAEPAALPAPGPAREPAPDRRERRAPAGDGGGEGWPPKTGKALFAWAKEKDGKEGTDVLRFLSSTGKSFEFPARIVQWNGDQVDQALREYKAKHGSNGATRAADRRTRGG